VYRGANLKEDKVKKYFIIVSIIMLAVVSFLPVQAAEWDWVKSANMVNLSNTNYGMLILPMNYNDEFIFYIAPADSVDQNTVADCAVSYHEDPLNYLVKGTLHTTTRDYIPWRSDGHHLAMFTCVFSSGGYGNVHMVAGDNAILGFPKTEPTPEPENCCPKGENVLLCKDYETKSPLLTVQCNEKGYWYLSVKDANSNWKVPLWIKLPLPDLSCCPIEKTGLTPEQCAVNKQCSAYYAEPTEWTLFSTVEGWYIGNSKTSDSYRIIR
jgi:hypothetical protein